MDEKEDVKIVHKGRKGISVPLVLVFLAVLLFFEGFYLVNGISKMGFTRRPIKEAVIIKAINFMEDVKRGLEDAIEYSIYKASDDVLSISGFCGHEFSTSESGYCEENCKIPSNIKTFQCNVWWRDYDDTYEPATSEFIDYVTDRTFKRFEDYAEDYENEPPGNLNIPPYCPKPEGTSELIFTRGSRPRVYAEMANKDDQGNDIKITYAGKYYSLADNSTFDDAVGVTTLSLFEFAKNRFAIGDYVRDRFNQASNAMPNEWCEMLGGACDMRVSPSDCQDSYGDTCFDNNDPDSNCCWGDNCCCKNIYLGDRCADRRPSCSGQLSNYCRINYNEAMGCRDDDYNCNGVVTAVERYNYTIQGILDSPASGTDVYGNEFAIDISRQPPTNCIKVGYDPDSSWSGILSVDWREYQGREAEFQEICNKIRQSCDDRPGDVCRRGEGCPEPSCLPDGSCPSDMSSDEYRCPGNCGDWRSCSDTCVEYECPYSESNPCEVTSCEGDCYLSGDNCILYEYCYGEIEDIGDYVCSCEKVVDEYYDCESHPDCGYSDTCLQWSCGFSWECRAEACGNECWESTQRVYEDFRCTYDYFGTANLSVTVSDEVHSYPIFYQWANLELPFYVASGNTNNRNLMCEAASTDDPDLFPEWQYCKTDEPSPQPGRQFPPWLIPE